MKRIQNPRFVAFFLLIATCLIILLAGFLSHHEMRISTVSIDDYDWSDDEITHVYLANLKTDSNAVKNTISVYGWCYIEEVETNPIEIRVLLHGHDSDDTFSLPTVVVPMPELTKQVHDGTNYDNAGFWVNMDYSDSDFPSDVYDVYLLYTAGDEDPILVDLERRIAM